MSHAMTWYQLSDAGMRALTSSAPSSSIFSPLHNDIIAPNLRAVAYGDGFFSTMGVHNAQLLWQSYHQARIKGHCQALQLTISAKVEQQLWNEIRQFAATIGDGLIKVILSRPAQSLRGYASSSIFSPLHNDIIAPNLRAVAYGDGFFSTMGVHNAQLLWQSYHQARIKGHCQVLQLTISAKVEQQLWNEIRQFAATIGDGLIKVILSRPAQSLRGYAYSTQAVDNEALIWLGVMQTAALAEHTARFLSGHLDDGQSLGQQVLQQPPIIAKCLQSQLASLPQPLAGLKSLNRLDGVMIAGELQRHKQHNPELAEGLVADMNGNWVEGVMSNFFYRLKPALATEGNEADSDVWYTPPIEQSGVRGVMRQVIVDKLAKLGAPAKLRYLRNEDLSQLEAMFFCNAVRGVVPVQQLWFRDECFQLSTSIYSKDG